MEEAILPQTQEIKKRAIPISIKLSIGIILFFILTVYFLQDNYQKELVKIKSDSFDKGYSQAEEDINKRMQDLINNQGQIPVTDSNGEQFALVLQKI